MFDHVKFGVSDYEASKAFYLKALAPLGVVAGTEGPPSYGVELYVPGCESSLCIFQTSEKPAPLHLAFVATHRQQVEAFHAAAVDAGGRDNGPPGLRPKYHANYFAAFVIGPDGHNIEAVCHSAEDQPFLQADLPSTGRLSQPMGSVARVAGSVTPMTVTESLAGIQTNRQGDEA